MPTLIAENPLAKIVVKPTRSTHQSSYIRIMDRRAGKMHTLDVTFERAEKFWAALTLWVEANPQSRVQIEML
mgnify:FL=1